MRSWGEAGRDATSALCTAAITTALRVAGAVVALSPTGKEEAVEGSPRLPSLNLTAPPPPRGAQEGILCPPSPPTPRPCPRADLQSPEGLGPAVAPVVSFPVSRSGRGQGRGCRRKEPRLCTVTLQSLQPRSFSSGHEQHFNEWPVDCGSGASGVTVLLCHRARGCGPVDAHLSPLTAGSSQPRAGTWGTTRSDSPRLRSF